MLLLGIDLGTSSVKISVIDAQSQVCIASAQYPETELEVIALQPGWAEQSPGQWWENTIRAILKCHSLRAYDPAHIGAIGIAYQMHGLVMVNSEQQVLRDAIIWCDSRGVPYGERAATSLGEGFCLSNLLNLPGNFTASKLAWVKEHEPSVFSAAHQIMLPGDYIAMMLTSEVTTTPSGLSEGVFWDFQANTVSQAVLDVYGFDRSLLAPVKPVFSTHGLISKPIATRLSLRVGIPVTYKAGDQLNNALSLNVLEPGEVAATAGTSGVIYGISDQLAYDNESRINSFAHLNHSAEQARIGVLLCINGVGIFNRWLRNLVGVSHSYSSLNEEASRVEAGSEGLFALPFGNGAERMLQNRIIGSHFLNLDVNRHGIGHMARTVQESIAFAFRYGLDIMRQNGINPSVIRAARTNLFLSDVFTSSFAAVNNVEVEFYDGDGSFGAALGAGIGVGVYRDPKEAAEKRKPMRTVEPANAAFYDGVYSEWLQHLNDRLQNCR